MKVRIKQVERAGPLCVYEAETSLPRRVKFSEILDVYRELASELRLYKPDMVVHADEGSVEALGAGDAGATGIRATLQGSSWKDDCVHLADSDQPSEMLSVKPCELCGRYFADD